MIEVLTSESVKKMDKATIEEWGMPSILLMENAIFSIVKHFENLDNILIICGTGNNGGDGLVLARHLYNKNKNVKVCVASGIKAKTKDFEVNYELLKKLPIEILLLDNDNSFGILERVSKESEVVVDCLFGTGLKRKIENPHADIIQIINRSKAFIISIDVPSGLCSSTGKTLGETVEADKTITLQTMKMGFLNYDALKYLGELSIEQIGIPSMIIKKVSEKVQVLEKKDVIKLVPKRKIYGHKGNYGKLLIIAGSSKYSGAAYLTTKAAIKTGSGLVNLYTSKELKVSLESKLNEAIISNYDSDEELKKAIEKSDVIAFGPGLGNTNETLHKLKIIINHFKGKLLIDADGINVLSNNLKLLDNSACEIIITPHPGEMSRITGKSIDYINKNRIEVSKEFSSQHRVVVLLKGLYTSITGGEEVFVNPTGNSAMASGGMGDTLSGIIASLIGQGLDILEAAQLGAYLHGYVGDNLSKTMYSVNANEVIKNIPLFLKEFTLKKE